MTLVLRRVVTVLGLTSTCSVFRPVARSEGAHGTQWVDGRCSPPASHGPLCHAHQNFDAGRVAPSDQLSVVLAGWTVLANQILTFAHRSRLRAFDPLVEAAGSISEVTQACRPCSQALGDTPTD